MVRAAYLLNYGIASWMGDASAALRAVATGYGRPRMLSLYASVDFIFDSGGWSQPWAQGVAVSSLVEVGEVGGYGGGEIGA